MNRVAVFVGAACGVALLVAVIVWMKREPTVPQLAPEVARRAARDIPVAVAQLENHEAREAIALEPIS